MHGTTHFRWGDDAKRVIALQSSADLLTTMLELLGDVNGVSNAFDNALITPECKLA
ncbi:hypothetical protein L915_17929 [Phytophthora nicotianae]|uniref:Uncharacterized protein n=1 Tax=Phytophthora nicotianae TaxID=4792 RepID=W2FZJ4_PHYNI|nr:hypothetical protein L915_17929 [Phytophthora nicotianae]ETL28877.1 hypothetical protein L916_17826 [Phytophthora nicotianae]ETM35326.1 hypothetical protein L914_17737 [Phytophthora nicotianae]